MSKIICNLLDNNNNLIPQVFGGIDTSNILASSLRVDRESYTAQQDCIVRAKSTQGYRVKLDEEYIESAEGIGGTNISETLIYVKKGQTIQITSKYSLRLTIFGVKR